MAYITCNIFVIIRNAEKKGTCLSAIYLYLQQDNTIEYVSHIFCGFFFCSFILFSSLRLDVKRTQYFKKWKVIVQRRRSHDKKKDGGKKSPMLPFLSSLIWKI